MAAVFKVRKRALQRLLRDHFDDIGRFGNWTETLTSQLESETHETYFYVKVRSADACALKYPIGDFYDVMEMECFRRDEDLKRTYCFDSYNGAFHGVVVSRHRGDRVDAESRSHELPQSVDALCGALRRAATSAVSIARAGYPHSDVLPHNLVFDGEEFHLIDVDEVVHTKSRKIPGRTLAYQDDDDYNWLTALEYPNFLRDEPVLYTQVQLVASLLSLANACMLWDDPGLDKVEERARNIGAWLQNNDRPDSFIDRHNDHVRYTRLENLCRTVVKDMILNDSE